MDSYYCMANQPGANTVATSFTLPRQLYEALQQKALAELTNQSDIVRRALLRYLEPAERAAVLRQISAQWGVGRAVPARRGKRFIPRPNTQGLPASKVRLRARPHAMLSSRAASAARASLPRALALIRRGHPGP
jgi:Arc/MetJ-type ribon-helix-helix transcriptional regulator